MKKINLTKSQRKVLRTSLKQTELQDVNKRRKNRRVVFFYEGDPLLKPELNLGKGIKRKGPVSKLKKFYNRRGKMFNLCRNIFNVHKP